MQHFSKLAINKPDDLRFGVSPKPLTTRRGMTIGGGVVYPELNFTLPTMSVDQSTVSAVQDQYRQIISGALARGGAGIERPGGRV